MSATTTRLAALILDCADPSALAAFWAKATGWEVVSSDADSAALSDGGTVQLAFQRVEDYRAPGWPDARKHAHLDLSVATGTDLETAAGALLALGAARPAFQPGEGEWIVLTDPEGHAFCLVPE